MVNIGLLELIVVLVIALVVLGPKRLPEAGKSIGKGMREPPPRRTRSQRARGDPIPRVPRTNAAHIRPTSPCRRRVLTTAQRKAEKPEKSLHAGPFARAL